MMHRLIARYRPQVAQILLLATVALLPIQYRFYKILRPLSQAAIPFSVKLPSYFEKNFSFYLIDFFLVALACLALYRRAIDWSSRPNQLLLGLLLFCFLSILLSPFANYPLQYYQLFRYAIPMILFFALSSIAMESSWRRRCLQAIFYLALFECAVAITQYFLQGSIGLKLLGEMKLDLAKDTPSYFSITHGSRWLFDELFDIKRSIPLVLRAYGTLPHPNILGGFLILAILCTYALYATAETKHKRRLYLFALFPFIFTLNLTYSRSALIGFATASALWFLIQKNRRFLPLLSTALLSAFVSLCLLYHQFCERGGIVNYNEIARSSDSIRTSYQNVALTMIQHHPLIGVGFNNYLLRLEEFAKEPLQPYHLQAVHNIYLLIGAEAGLPALAAFLAFLGTVLYKALRQPFEPEHTALLAIFLAFLAIGLRDFYLWNNFIGQLMLFLVAGLLVNRNTRV